jgi:hypothetical protein
VSLRSASKKIIDEGYRPSRQLLPGDLWDTRNDPSTRHGRPTRLKVAILFGSIMIATLGLAVVCTLIVTTIEQMPMSPSR